jgi:hypothetical protein
LGRSSQNSSTDTIDDIKVDLSLRLSGSAQDSKVVGINKLENDFSFFGNDFSEETLFTIIVPASNFINFLLWIREYRVIYSFREKEVPNWN